MDILIQGFSADERRPTYGESPHINATNRWMADGEEKKGILYDDWNFHSLLVYSDLSNNILTYLRDEQLPNLRYEDQYMQPALVPVLERLADLVVEEGFDTVWVTDAWAQNTGHGTYSKHYEGRGVDLDTPPPAGAAPASPKDIAKLGRLAYLAEKAAQEVGVTYWIWNETEGNPPRPHVHMSIRGPEAQHWKSGVRCDAGEGCLPHIYNASREFSAAAVGAMIVKWQGWDSIDEVDFYRHSGVQGWGNLTCEVMAKTLNKYIDRGWECIRTQTREEALRIAAFWMEHTLDQGAFLGAEHYQAFPVAIPMQGDYGYWVAVEGYVATEDPNGPGQGSVDEPGGGSYIVGALQVVDPQVDSRDRTTGEYAKRFITAYELGGGWDIRSESTTIPNLGLYYAPTGPNNTFELVVPAGCKWTGYLAPMNTFAVSSVSSIGNSPGQICDSRFSIVNPPAGSVVSTNLPLRVIALGPPNAIGAYLTVKEDTPSGIPFEYFGNRLYTAVDFTGTVWEFDMWQPGFLSDYRLSISADLGSGIQHCGTTLVTASSSRDITPPQVSFLQPLDQEHIKVKQEYRIQVRALDNQGIQKNSFDNDLVKVQIRLGDNLETLTTYELCGPNCYEFRWRLGPNSPDGEYKLTATAIDVAGLEGYSSELKIPVGRGEPLIIDHINLVNGQLIEERHAIRIIAKGGLGQLMADLRITGPEPIERKGIPIEKGIEELLLDWNPSTNGSYTVRVRVYDTLLKDNEAVETRSVQVRRKDIIWDGEWKRLSPATSPGVKNAAMVDTGNGIYLFGGQRISGGAFSNKLWKWDGSNWVDQTPGSPSTWPGARIYPQLAYDSNRGRLVLFAGIATDGTILHDVWEYAISTGLWADRTKYPFNPYNWPAALHLQPSKEGKGATRFAYDALHDRPLYLYISTFLWNSELGNWEIFGNTYRPELSWVSYDAGRNLVVSYTPDRSPEIAEWDGSKWKEIQTPSEGLKPNLKQSNLIGSPYGVYLIGGEARTKELWHWDGRLWTRIHASAGTPPNTDYYSASVAFDNSRNQLVVYTTNGQTWVYSSQLENLAATPTLFTSVWPPDSNYKLGPGMELTFRPHPHPSTAAYETQVSEDGGVTWQACTNCGYNLDGAVQHHGNFDPKGCGHGYHYCLKREQSYSYRVRPLNQAGRPMLDWTYVYNAVSFDWPARVEIEAQSPGPYQNGETVTLKLKDSYGQGMNVDWIISAWGGATYTVEEGCGSGQYYKHLISQICTLTIGHPTAQVMHGTAKLAALEPPASIDVLVTGTDIWNNTSISNKITLNFESGDEPPRIAKVEPMLYPDEYGPGKKYGPGMRLEWIHSPHPERAFYEIQFSEDGGVTWQIYMSARDDQYDWVNHHGNLFCEHGFYRCLKRNQVYHYRIRALDVRENPITDWSSVVSATSMEWPAHVEIAATPPGPQYPNNSVVTLDLVNTYGQGLQIGWEIVPQGKAAFVILEDTCQNGAFHGQAKVQQCKLRIWVNEDTSTSYHGESIKLAAPLVAFNSVRVVVTGIDSLGFSFMDDIDLSFKPPSKDPVEESSYMAPKTHSTET